MKSINIVENETQQKGRKERKEMVYKGINDSDY